MTREETIDYAEREGVPIMASRDRIYSIDENLWGRAVECGAIEDPWAAPPDDVYALTVETLTEPVEVIVAFEAGVPVALDGSRLALVDLALANALARNAALLAEQACGQLFAAHFQRKNRHRPRL